MSWFQDAGKSRKCLVGLDPQIIVLRTFILSFVKLVTAAGVQCEANGIKKAKKSKHTAAQRVLKTTERTASTSR